jgi:hypothetical protein
MDSAGLFNVAPGVVPSFQRPLKRWELLNVIWGFLNVSNSPLTHGLLDKGVKLAIVPGTYRVSLSTLKQI